MAPVTPAIQACLICDLVREEGGGKVAILGLYGVCPNVEVRIPYLDKPAALTFVFSGGPAQTGGAVAFDILDMATGRVVASTGELSFRATPTANTLLAPALLVVFGGAGQFVARCSFSGSEAFRAEFRVAQAPPPILP